jgi:hypothetical protein
MAATWKKLAYDGPSYSEKTLTTDTWANTCTAQIETVEIYSLAARDFTDITSESNGLIRILMMKSTSAIITIKHDVAKIKLAGAEDLPLNAGDVLGLVSWGGVWNELFRVLF